MGICVSRPGSGPSSGPGPLPGPNFYLPGHALNLYLATPVHNLYLPVLAN